MSDTVGTAKIAITADSSGVEVGTAKAKRSLADLGKSAEKSGSQMAAGSARASRAIDAYVQKLQFSTATLGKTKTEIKLLELAQRGATQEQLRMASAALRTADAFKRQEAAAARVAQAGQLAGRLIAAGLVATSAAAVLMARSSINALDAMNDLSDATGASIENISALDRVARQNGGTFEQVTSILTKFNKVLSDSDEEGQRAADVLKKMGLDAAELKRMDPAEALHKAAVAMSQFAQDGNRARAVQLLFGRSVGELAPLLKDLSEQERLVATTSTQAAADAETFNKNLFRLKANAEDAARSLVADLIPAINRLFEKGRSQGFAAIFGFDDEFFRKKRLAELAGEVISLNSQLKQLKGQMLRGLVGPEAQAEIDELTASLERAKKAFRDADRGFTPSRAGAGRGFINPPFAAPSIGTIPEDSGNKPAAAKVSEAQRYLESLQKQLQATRDLTVYETLLDDLQKKRIDGVTPELRTQLEVTAKQIDSSRAQAKALDEVTKARERAAQMQAAADEAAAAGAEQLMSANQQLREEIELIGAEGTARTAIEQARISSTIALKEEALVMLQNSQASAAQISAMEREIELLRERKGLLSRRDAAEATADAAKAEKDFAKGLNDDLKSAFNDAFSYGTQNPLQAFGQALARTLYQRASSALADALANALTSQLLGGGGAGGGGIGGLITSIIGFFFHDGGIAGSGGKSRAVSPALFAGARRYHSGGLAGDEVPAVLQRGEGVFTRPQMRALGAGLATVELMNMGARQFHAGGQRLPPSPAGGGDIHIVNNTQGRVDRVERRTTPEGDQVLVLEQAMVGWLQDPNSRVSRTLGRSTTATRRR